MSGSRSSRARRILAGLVVLTFVASCIGLGLWQLRRNHEKRAFNARVESRSSQPAVPLESLTPGEQTSFRRAVAVGTYDTAREIVLTSHPLRGIAGNHVVTPLVLSNDSAVFVDRGWVPLVDDEPPVASATPPSGQVRVQGVLMETQVRGRFGPVLPPTGVLKQAFRLEVPRLSQQLPYRVHPMWMQLQSQDPPQSEQLPRPVPLLKLDAGPHLSYAIQWFLFAAVAIAGSIALEIRRRKASRGPLPAPVETSVPR